MARKKIRTKNDKKRTLVFKTKKGIKRHMPKSVTEEQNALGSTENQTISIPNNTESNDVEG